MISYFQQATPQIIDSLLDSKFNSWPPLANVFGRTVPSSLKLGGGVAGSDPEAVPEVRHPVRGHPRVSVQPEAHDLFGDGY